jgi:hypothetical protein
LADVILCLVTVYHFVFCHGLQLLDGKFFAGRGATLVLLYLVILSRLIHDGPHVGLCLEQLGLVEVHTVAIDADLHSGSYLA